MDDKEKKGKTGEGSLPEDVELFDTIFREELLAEEKGSPKGKAVPRKRVPAKPAKSSEAVPRTATPGAAAGQPTREVAHKSVARSQGLRRPQTAPKDGRVVQGTGVMKRPGGQLPTAAAKPKTMDLSAASPKTATHSVARPERAKPGKPAPRTADHGAEGSKAKEDQPLPQQKALRKKRGSLKLLLACVGLILLAGAAFQYLVSDDFAFLTGLLKEKKEVPRAPAPEVKQKVPIKTPAKRPAPPPAPPGAQNRALPAPPVKAPEVKEPPGVQVNRVSPREAAPPVPQDQRPPTPAPPEPKPAPQATPPNPPQPQTAAAEKPSVYPYCLYLGSYQSAEGAERAVSLYSGRGLSPYVAKVDLGQKGIWYRVFAGGFRTLKEAEAFIREKQISGAEAWEKVPGVSPEKPLRRQPVPDTKPALPTVAERPPQPQRAAAESAPSYPYSIYLGSYQDLERAKAAVSHYAEMGLSPYWVKVDLDEKGIWYRVFAGHFQNRQEADSLIRRKGIQDAESRGTKYAVLISSYRTAGDAEKMRSNLTGLGLSSYVIEKGTGDLRLYVGAYHQKSRAEEQRSELASRGVQGQVVER